MTFSVILVINIQRMRNIMGGLAGAIALNVLHEVVRKFIKDAPHVHIIGEQALSKSMRELNLEPPTGQTLYFSTLAGDVIANSVYFSLIGKSKRENLLGTGLLYGIAGGLGAVLLSKPLGLDDRPVNRTTKTTAMTIGYYALGGLVAATVIRELKKKRNHSSI